jgi:hypothetical protein
VYEANRGVYEPTALIEACMRLVQYEATRGVYEATALSAYSSRLWVQRHASRGRASRARASRARPHRRRPGVWLEVCGWRCVDVAGLGGVGRVKRPRPSVKKASRAAYVLRRSGCRI